MENNAKELIKNTNDITFYLSAFSRFGKGLIDKNSVLKSLNEFLLNFLTDNPIKTVGVPGNVKPGSDKDNSFETFIPRALYNFVKQKPNILDSTLSNNFDFSNPSCYPRILQLKVVQEIVRRLQNLDINQENANKFVYSSRCLLDLLDLSRESCIIFENNVKYVSCKVRLISLDMFIKITNLSVQSYNSDTRDLFYIFCFTDTGSFPNQEYISEENFYCDGESFPDDKIYKLFNNISMDALGAFFRNKNFIKKLGGVQRLTNFLRMKLIMYQLSKLIRSIFVFLFGIGLLFASGFAWSLLFLLSLGFLISGITTFTNSILYMKPSRFRARLAKCFKYCAWIINGALLITLGVTFCVGVLEIALITLGSLEILRGLFKEFVRVGFAVMCAVMCMTGILLALNPAILPIALPFLPTMGTGIAVLSGLGFVKSALSLFYNGSSWQFTFYHVAKYTKAGMFVLCGVALIALPFSSIVAALASIIGLPTLVLNIFSLAIGVCAFLKGGISFTRLPSIIKFLLANQEMEIANKNDFVPGVLEKTKSKSEDTNFNNPKTTSQKRKII